jgi:hypothetical protein
MLSRGYYGLSERKLDPVQLSRDQNAGIEIANHTYGLELLQKGILVRGNIEARHSANFRITQWRDYGTQIVRVNANIAVVDDQDFVLCFAH